ncbi:MAG: hypothetical protein FWE20_03635 [Defluviitaleaceae bacterium]|nr:hypothetical protein [Defluviitaleaceae bacterium]
MKIQADILFLLEQDCSISDIGMVILSHMGLDFKEEFILMVQEFNEDIYKSMFLNGELCNYDIKYFLEWEDSHHGA